MLRSLLQKVAPAGAVIATIPTPMFAKCEAPMNAALQLPSARRRHMLGLKSEHVAKTPRDHRLIPKHTHAGHISNALLCCCFALPRFVLLCCCLALVCFALLLVSFALISIALLCCCLLWLAWLRFAAALRCAALLCCCFALRCFALLLRCGALLCFAAALLCFALRCCGAPPNRPGKTSDASRNECARTCGQWQGCNKRTCEYLDRFEPSSISSRLDAWCRHNRIHESTAIAS